jgi:hypothetical protein
MSDLNKHTVCRAGDIAAADLRCPSSQCPSCDMNEQQAPALRRSLTLGSRCWLLVLAMVACSIMAAFPAAAKTATLNAGTCVDNTSVGTQTWSNPGNAAGATGASGSATVSMPGFSGSQSHYLLCTGFAFTIPARSVINSITVVFNGQSSSSSGSIYDGSVKIVQNGSATGTENARSSSTKWSTTATNVTYAGGTWGATWTAGDGASTDVNATGFGVAISAKRDWQLDSSRTGSIESVTITIDYTPRRQQAM